jgi:hypothetical protein
MNKNLIFYCYLKNGEVDESTQFNLKLIEKYSHVFNGEQIIKVAFDDPKISDEQRVWVRNLFSYFKNPSIEIVKNNPDTRESEYFIESIKEIKNDDSLTFFCHNKGNTHTSPEIKNNLYNWVFSMYFFNLDKELFSRIEKPLLNEITFAGVLRKTLDCTPWVCAPWHFSGTFFWFNTKRLKENPSWDTFEKGRFSVEAYPGQKADLRHSYSNFVSLNLDYNVLFDNSFWPTVLTENVLGKETLNLYRKTYDDVMTDKKNLVIITSVIRNPKKSIYLSEETRLEQTANTILTIKDKIPNPYILLLEGGPQNKDDENELHKVGVDEYYYFDVSLYPKDGGEIKMLNDFFNSKRFDELKEEIASVSKISGRYYLNSNFKWSSNNIIKKDDVSWSGKGACSTRFFKFSIEQINHFTDALKKLDESFNTVIDLEHGFYEFNVVPFQDCIDGAHVGVSGFVSPLGIWEDA